jgi:hypothetical protein
MPNTLIPIQTYTLSSSASSVTFSNIPQNYTDLQIVASVRSTRNGNNDFVQIKFNNSTTNYSAKFLYGSVSTSSFTDTKIYGYTSSLNFTANIFGSISYYVPNYTSSTNKSVSVNSVSENNANTTDSYALVLVAGQWSDNSAITSVTLQTLSGTDNFVTNSTFTLYGVSNGVKATGGTLTVAGGYAYHTFTSTGSFLPSQKITGAEVITIAGGGGGSQAGGGGGAGGLLFSPYQTFNAGSSYTAVIGAGSSGTSGGSNASKGTNSMFGPYTALGGGGGSRANSGDVSANISGGSGGGAGGGTGTYNKFGAGTSGQGNNGGQGENGSTYYSAGGGGGAGGVGGNVSVAIGGAGGNGTGTYSTWANATGTGVSGLYAGGGGGGGGQGGFNAPGASNGGGGAGGGGTAGTANNGIAGTANTGGGGGGGGVGNSVDGNGGNGGSGLVIVRYPLS